MLPAAARISVRLHRFGVTAVGLAVLVLALLAVWYAIRLDGFSGATGCLTSGGDSCQGYLGIHDEASRVLTLLAIAPFLAGVILGAPIVAQEIERATAPLAWWLDPSRWRWFLQRFLPILALAFAFAFAAAIVSEHLEARLFPFADPGASFHDFGMHGVLLASRFLLALGCGVFIGALAGRLLPALVLSLLLAIAITIGLGGIHEGLLAREAAPVPADSIEQPYAGLQVDFRYRLKSGELVTEQELEARFPDPAVRDQELSAAEQITYVVPPGRSASAAAWEALLSTTIAGILTLAAALVVIVRRPGFGWVRIGVPVRRARRQRVGTPRGDSVSPFDRVRLILWPHRFELVAAVALTALVSAICVFVVGGLLSMTPPATCLADLTNIPINAECSSVAPFLELASEWGDKFFAAMAIIPWVIGVLLGVVFVGREIEQSTATLAWSLASDRRSWLLSRAAVGLALTATLLVVPSVLATEMQAVARPWVPADMTLDNYALRGPLIVIRGSVAFSLALLAGAVLGRVLPALLVAGVACGAVVLALQMLWPYGQASEHGAPAQPGTGATLPGEQASIPGERLRDVELREGLWLSGLIIGLVAVTTVAVDRRTPY